MLTKRLALLSLLIALGAAPALARPVVIARLGDAPLLGPSVSTSDLRARVAAHPRWMRAAAAKLGLSAGEYAAFAAAVRSSHVAWVVVPRRLDAMTWRSGTRVYVLRDVEIPARTNGWEIDVRAHGRLLALFMPAACGNLSLIVRPLPARVAALPRDPVAAATPVPLAVATDPVAIPDDSLDETTAAPPAIAQAFPPVAHQRAFFWYPLLFGLAALGGHGGPTTPCGCP